MLKRLDHIIIAVRDLDLAMEHYHHLGFEVIFAGKHHALGTCSAHIRFGLTYIELISTFDPGKTMQALPGSQTLLNILDQRDGVMLGFALVSTDLEQDIERLSPTGLVIVPSYTVQRMQPDGEVANVQIFMPGGFPWRRPWPFLYQFEIQDAQRFAGAGSDRHQNGVTSLQRVIIGVNSKDFKRTSDLYQHHFGLELCQQDLLARLAAQRVTFRIGSAFIDLLAPQGQGPLQEELSEIGEGVFEVILGVNDLRQTSAFFKSQGIAFSRDGAGPGTLLLASEETFGTRCILVEQSQEM